MLNAAWRLTRSVKSNGSDCATSARNACPSMQATTDAVLGRQKYSVMPCVNCLLRSRSARSVGDRALIFSFSSSASDAAASRQNCCSNARLKIQRSRMLMLEAFGCRKLMYFPHGDILNCEGCAGRNAGSANSRSGVSVFSIICGLRSGSSQTRP